MYYKTYCDVTIIRTYNVSLLCYEKRFLFVTFAEISYGPNPPTIQRQPRLETSTRKFHFGDLLMPIRVLMKSWLACLVDEKNALVNVCGLQYVFTRKLLTCQKSIEWMQRTSEISAWYKSKECVNTPHNDIKVTSFNVVTEVKKMRASEVFKYCNQPSLQSWPIVPWRSRAVSNEM